MSMSRLSSTASAARGAGRYSVQRSAGYAPRRVRQIPGRRTFFTIIEQGYEGWRLTFGSNPTKLETGLRLSISLVHTVQKVDIRETSIDIHDLAGFTSDNVPVLVSGSLFFRVNDSYNACFSVTKYRDNVRNIGTSAIRSIMGHFTYDEVICDRNKTNMTLHEIIGNTIEKWGIECTRFEIQTFRPLNREIEQQLELQMAAERERRKQLLDTQALVNVAEGHKQRSILESEGDEPDIMLIRFRVTHIYSLALQASLNQAAGQKQMRILESEGAREASVNEARALGDQVSIISQALGGENDASIAAASSKVVDVLVELRRLEQLKAIAKGSGNATYFLDSLKVGRDAYEVENVEKWKRALEQRAQADLTVSH